MTVRFRWGHTYGKLRSVPFLHILFVRNLVSFMQFLRKNNNEHIIRVIYL